MSIKPVLVPDQDAATLRRLMDRFADASTGPTRQQLTESRAAVAQAQQNLSEGIMDTVKRTFNDNVAGWPMGTSREQFIQGWAEDIKDETGRDIPLEKLGQLYDDYSDRADQIMQSHGTTNESSGVTEGIMDTVKQAYNDTVVDADWATTDEEFIRSWASQIEERTGKSIPIEKLVQLHDHYRKRSPEIMQSHGTYNEAEGEQYSGTFYDPKYDTPDRSDQAAADFKQIMAKHNIKSRDDAERNREFQHEILNKHAKRYGGTYQVDNHFGWSDKLAGKSGPNWHRESGVAEGSDDYRVTWTEAGQRHTTGVLLKAQAVDSAKKLQKKSGASDVKVVPYSDVAEGMPDLDHMPGAVVKNPAGSCKRCHGHGTVYKTADGKVVPGNQSGAKRYKCGACGSKSTAGAFGDMMGGSADQLTSRLKIREQGVAEGVEFPDYNQRRMTTDMAQELFYNFAKQFAAQHGVQDKSPVQQIAALAQQAAMSSGDHKEAGAKFKQLFKKYFDQGMFEGEGMSRAAKGYEKYGKEGMEALARAGREGRALDPVRDQYDRYDESVVEESIDPIEQLRADILRFSR